MEKLVPKDSGEAVAVFRSQVLGALVHSSRERGQLHASLVALSQQRRRPPGSAHTRTFSVPTLERWYYAWKRRGLEALVPRPRKDRGLAQALDEATRQLLLDLRREHPSASVRLLLRTLVAQGRLRQGAVSPTTVRRLFASAGLERVSQRKSPAGTVRRRWEAAFPGALWHGDVCHGPTLAGAGWRCACMRCWTTPAATWWPWKPMPASEQERLGLFVAALRRWGRPDALYLDNGSTYSGLALTTACARLGARLRPDSKSLVSNCVDSAS